jgi:hypothetical protein
MRTGPMAKRHRAQLAILAGYAGLSFVFMFTMNYGLEVRAYRQLSSMPELFRDRTNCDGIGAPASAVSSAQDSLRCAPTWSGPRIYVPTYHENYGKLTPLYLTIGAITVAALGILLGWIVVAEEKKHARWRMILGVGLYLIPAPLMHWKVYPDMDGLILVSFIYGSLFYLIRGIQHFNPHRALSSSSGRIEASKFHALLNLYQKYLFLLVGVLGFVAVTFMIGASTLLQSILSRGDPFGARVYDAVRMPYLQAVYSLAGFACVALGFGAIVELHEKTQELLRLTPIEAPACR